MKLRYSLLTLFGLTALIALELVTLKTDYIAVFFCTELFLECSVLVTTWGAFLLTGNVRQFTKGFSIAGWSYILFGVFTNINNSNYLETELAKLVADMIGHELRFFSIGSEVIDPTGHYFRLWFLWSVFNCGLVGGFAALRLNRVKVPKVASAVDAVESQGK